MTRSTRDVISASRRRARVAVSRWSASRLIRQTQAALVPPPRRMFAAFGEGSVIVPPTRVETPECIRIGKMVWIHENCWLSVQQRPGAPLPRLEIDDDCKIQRFTKILCHGHVRLGRGVLLGDRVYICDVEYMPGDADVDPDLRPLTEPRPVVIGDGTFVGLGAVIKPGVTIGRLAYIAAGSVVADDVPDRTLVAGSPARAIRKLDHREGPPAGRL